MMAHQTIELTSTDLSLKGNHKLVSVANIRLIETLSIEEFVQAPFAKIY